KASPALSTHVSVQSLTVGAKVSDVITLSGGFNPGGTLTVNVYGPGDATCTQSLASTTLPVSGNGTYASADVTTSAPGNYGLVAGYGGDPSTAAAGPGSCADAAELAVARDAGDPASTCGATGMLAADGLSCTYRTVGSDTFNVPAGVSSATFTVVGAQG